MCTGHLLILTENTTDIFWKVLGRFTIVNCVSLSGFYPLCSYSPASKLLQKPPTKPWLLRAPPHCNHQSIHYEKIKTSALLPKGNCVAIVHAFSIIYNFPALFLGPVGKKKLDRVKKLTV